MHRPRPVKWLVLGSLVAGAAALTTIAPLPAQTPSREPAVVELPGSTRALGLGHAFQPDASDSDAVFYDPALASRARGFALGVHWLRSAARSFTVSAAAPWFGGGVAVGLQALEYGASDAPGRRRGGLDPLLDEGGSPDDGPPTHAVSEMVGTASWGRSYLGFQVGVGAKLIDQRFDTRRRQVAAADVGVARELGPGWASLSVRNLGPERSFEGVDLRLPTGVTLGWGAYGRPLGPLDVGGAAAVTRRADGEMLYGGGVELGYWPIQGRTFVARLGVRNVPEGEASPVTFGGSFWGDQLVLEYGFQPVDDGDGIHRFTLGWR